MGILLVFILLLLTFFYPQETFAHAFGQLYNLPVPFWMYVYGCAAAIIFSFLIIGSVVNKDMTAFLTSIQIKKLSFLTIPWVLLVVKIASMVCFLFLLLTGFIGEDDATNNISMTFFWIIFVLGISYVIGIFGNIWPLINPIKIISELFGSFLDKGVMTYPKKLGYYPALFFYFLFIWIELFAGTTPNTLALLITLYMFLQIMGMFIFGKKEWLQHGEFFTVFFHLLGKMGIFEKKHNKIYLRMPFSGLLKEKATHFSIILFILFMLSSTAYDGFSGTSVWESIYLLFYDQLYLFWGDSLNIFFETIGLALSPFLFLSLYVLFIYFAKILTQNKKSLLELLLQFGYSLIPIAFAYNIAHYFTLLITEGQNMYRLISDPFGYGWNLFGTKGEFEIFIPDANFIWHAQVGIILLGHIVGVYIAHVIALRIFPNHKQAVLSQIPMLVLMVIYTMVGLWILSQPITAEI